MLYLFTFISCIENKLPKYSMKKIVRILYMLKRDQEKKGLEVLKDIFFGTME